MNKQTKITLSCAAVAGIIAVSVFSLTPHNYEDCVLANIDKSDNPQASAMIARVCRAKFPLDPDPISMDEMYGKGK